MLQIQKIVILICNIDIQVNYFTLLSKILICYCLMVLHRLYVKLKVNKLSKNKE